MIPINASIRPFQPIANGVQGPNFFQPSPSSGYKRPANLVFPERARASLLQDSLQPSPFSDNKRLARLVFSPLLSDRPAKKRKTEESSQDDFSKGKGIIGMAKKGSLS